jgi:hypothetical protein
MVNYSSDFMYIFMTNEDMIECKYGVSKDRTSLGNNTGGCRAFSQGTMIISFKTSPCWTKDIISLK